MPFITAFEIADPDLRSREVGQNRDFALRRLDRPACAMEGPTVGGVIAVRYVQSEDIRAGLDEAANGLLVARGRPQGRDNFSATLAEQRHMVVDGHRRSLVPHCVER